MNINDLDDYEVVGESEVEESQKKPVLNLSDLDNYEVESKSSDLDDKMGVLETLGLKVGEGASFGASDILSGVVGAAGSLLPDDEVTADLKEKGFKLPEESLLEAYRSSKDFSKRMQKKASDDRPGLSLAADIGGGFLTGSGVAKAAQGAGRLAKAAKYLPGADDIGKSKTLLEGAGKLIKEGAKAGALTGFLKGDADLTKGEVLETAKDTAKGAGIGATSSLALGGSAKALTEVAKGTGKLAKYVGKGILGGDKFDVGREAGRRGVDLFDEKQVAEELEKAAGSIKKEINKLFDDNDKFKMNKLLDKAGVKIKAGVPVKEAFDELVDQGVIDSSNRKAVDELGNFLNKLITKKTKKLTKIEQSIEKSAAQKLNKLKRTQGAIPETRTEFDTPIEDISILPDYKGTVKGVEDKVRLVDKNGDPIFKKIITQKAELEQLIPDKIPDIEDLTATELDNIIGSVDRYASEDANPEVIKVARKLGRSLRKLRNELGTELDDLDVAERYRKLSKGMNIKDMIGKRFFKSGDPAEAKLMTELKSIASSSEGSKLDKLNFIKNQLNEVDPEAASRVEKSTEFVQMINKLRKSDLEEGVKSLTPTTGFGMIGSSQTKFAQAVGKAEKKLGKEIVKGSEMLKKLTDSNYVAKVTNALGKLKGPAREQYNNVLEKLNAPDTPTRTKNAPDNGG